MEEIPTLFIEIPFAGVTHSTTPTLTLIKGRLSEGFWRQLSEIIPVLPPEQPSLCCSVGFWRRKDVWVPDLEPLHNCAGEVRAWRSERLLYRGRNAERLDTSGTTAPATFDSPAQTGSLQQRHRHFLSCSFTLCLRFCETFRSFSVRIHFLGNVWVEWLMWKMNTEHSTTILVVHGIVTHNSQPDWQLSLSTWTSSG